MSQPLIFGTDISETLNEKLYMPIGLTIAFFAFLGMFIIYGTIAEGYVIIFGLMASLPIIILTIKYPKFWIYLIAMSNVIFFYDRGKDVSSIEIVLAIEYLGTLLIWLLWEMLVNREKLIHNMADLAVLFYAIFIIINSIVAVLNDVEIMFWGREAANLLLVMFYFPIRKYFTDKKDLTRLLFIYGIVVAITAFLHFYTYSKAMSADIQYAYELAMGVRVNQTLFTSAAMFGFIFALYQKSKTKSILLVAFTVIAIGGLITSFSRTFWLFLVIGIFIIVFYLSGKQRIKLIFYGFFVSVVLFSSALFIFQDKANIILTLIEQRFVSTSKGTSDVSVQARLVEYDAVWRQIEKYPMAGNGLAKKFSFYNFLEQSTTRTSFIHNGYLYIMMKLGIPLMLVCFFPYLFYIIKGERLARKSHDEFFRLLSLGAYLTLILMIVSNFTAAQIIQRESVFVTALALAFIGISLNKLNTGKES